MPPPAHERRAGRPDSKEEYMNQSFFIGAVGAHQQLKRLAVQGNNIANVNTYAFKADKGRFAALMYDGVKNTEEAMVPTGVGAALRNTDTDFTPGAAADTGRPQDYMIGGEGFFALVDLVTGEVSLTRNGAFSMASLERASEEVDAYGNPIMEHIYYLSDGNGRFVLSSSGSMIEMTDPNEEQDVGVFDYINYNGMEKIGSTRFLAVDKNGGLRQGTSPVIHRALEMSNTDLAEEMTKVIESQRAYGMALKMVQTSDEIEATINNLRG